MLLKKTAKICALKELDLKLYQFVVNMFLFKARSESCTPGMNTSSVCNQLESFWTGLVHEYSSVACSDTEELITYFS